MNDRKPRRMSRKESQEETRQKLLDAAAEIISQVGFGKASADTIAEQAGYSKGAFYSNFSSKEEMAMALLQRIKDQKLKDFSQLLDSVDEYNSPLQVLEDWFSKNSINKDCPLLGIELKLLASRNREFGQIYNNFEKEQSKAIANLLKQLYVKINKKPQIEPYILSSALESLVNGIILRDDIQEQAGTVLTIILDSLLRSAENE